MLAEDREEVDRQFQEALEKRKDWCFECRVLRQDGKQRWIWANGRSLFDKDGQALRMLGLVQDITERKLIEESKLEAVGVLAGGVAHDFNNILSIVLGNLSLLLEDLKGMPDAEQMCRESQQAAIRGRDLTKQLLTFSTGGSPVKKVAELNCVIEDTTRFALRGSRNKCAFSLAEPSPAVDMDSGQISQVIQNLIINADQAMSSGGTISISTELTPIDTAQHLPLSPGRYVKIVIQDTGCGIPAGILNQVFTPFYTTKTGGIGLGLSTSNSIIKKHAGHIGVESVLDQGTIFSVYLPVTEAPIAQGGLPHPLSGLQSIKILFMDDEACLRNIAVRILGNSGHQVEAVSDGQEALLQYAEAMQSDNPFDLVILDLTIAGGMGGKETIQALLQLDPEVKAIVASGYGADPILADFEKYGFKYALEKPFHFRDLLRSLEVAFHS